jgi:hypothetical protein
MQEMLLESILKKMDLEAGIQMPDGRGPDRPVGRIRRANVGQSDNKMDIFARSQDPDLSIWARSSDATAVRWTRTSLP